MNKKDKKLARAAQSKSPVASDPSIEVTVVDMPEIGEGYQPAPAKEMAPVLEVTPIQQEDNEFAELEKSLNEDLGNSAVSDEEALAKIATEAKAELISQPVIEEPTGDLARIVEFINMVQFSNLPAIEHTRFSNSARSAIYNMLNADNGLAQLRGLINVVSKQESNGFSQVKLLRNAEKLKWRPGQFTEYETIIHTIIAIVNGNARGRNWEAIRKDIRPEHSERYTEILMKLGGLI